MRLEPVAAAAAAAADLALFLPLAFLTLSFLLHNYWRMTTMAPLTLQSDFQKGD
jgi:hypothetical protein